MTQIRCLYEAEPKFPATDQHPNAARFPVSIGVFQFADCVGGAPTQGELEAHLGLDAAGLADKARLEADESEAASVKADSQVLTFLNFSPAELDAWVDANITGAGNAAARTAFKVLGRIALAAGRGKVLR